MSARTRSRQQNARTGRYWVGNGPWRTGTQIGLDEICLDSVKQGDNNPLEIRRTIREGGILNGEKGGAGPVRFQDYPALALQTLTPTHLSLPAIADGVLASMLTSRTNPSRSSMGAIVSLIEAREVPQTIREIGQVALGKMYKRYGKTFRFLSRAAKLNLIIQFGIAPLIQDLMTCMQFQALVDQRVKEIDRLMKRGLRRTVTLDVASAQAVRNLTVQSVGQSISRTMSKNTRREIRGHVRWYVNENFSLSDAQVRAKAQKIVTGNIIDPLTIWELMPWSWLTDYFVNISDFVRTNRNELDASYSGIRIMEHTVTVETCPGGSFGSNGFVKMTPFKGVRETKYRRITSLGLGARPQFLTGKQTSILGSLSVLKLK